MSYSDERLRTSAGSDQTSSVAVAATESGSVSMTAVESARSAHAQGLGADRAMDYSEIERQRKEIERLRRQIGDLQIALLTSNEHGDVLEDYLYRSRASLFAEVQERQAVEERLQKIIESITREKGDLEILIQILNDQGDVSAEEGEQARIDGLTQIANRRRFDEFLLQEWERHRRTPETLSLLICDVDHFKLYNDHYGHQAGDSCLQTVAATIKNCFRPADLVARFGGEEFAVVLPQTSCEQAASMADRICATLEAASIPHAASLCSDRVTVSIGVGAAKPQRMAAAEVNQLIEAADRNLYAAKKGGRNRVVYQENGE